MRRREETEKEKEENIFFREKEITGRKGRKTFRAEKYFFLDENDSNIKLKMENVFLGWTINLLGEKIVGKENKAPFLLLELGSLLVQTGVIAPSLKRLPKTT